MKRRPLGFRLEPIGVRHADDLLALYLAPAVAQWYGPWSRERVEREVARLARSWSVDGVHKWMAYHRATGECVGRGGLSRKHVEARERLELTAVSTSSGEAKDGERPGHLAAGPSGGFGDVDAAGQS
ncbi:GNAT family N-acetyltransferase [Actinoplanes sp. G11-F43]|uniref:GNAT family N-acetyltransferase n=1 Tax=Actinoplanes sp. G11-F43 TaxID=3424130 RepID=UPI003D32C754